MSLREHFARRFRLQRFLEGSLATSGAFNIALGTMLSLAPNKPVAILHIPRPKPEFYLQALVLLVASLGGYYLLAASDVGRYSGIVTLAHTASWWSISS